MNNGTNNNGPYVSVNSHEYGIVFIHHKAPLGERVGAFIALVTCAVASLITTFSIAETWTRFACGMLCFVTATYLSDRCTQLTSSTLATIGINTIDIVLIGQAIYLIIQLVVSFFSKGSTPAPENICDYPCV